MAVSIAFLNNKGGVGKTTASAFIGYTLAQMGKKVLLIDCDPQANLTRDFGIEPKEYEGEQTLPDAIASKVNKRGQRKSAVEFIQPTVYENIDVLMSKHELLRSFDDLAVALARGQRIFKKIVDDIKATDSYDYIICDMRPSLGIENTQILLGVDFVIIPTSCDRNSIEGLGELKEFVEDCSDSNENLKLLGVLFNNVDIKDSTSRQVIDMVKELFGEELFETLVENSKVAEKLPWTGFKKSKNKSYTAFEAVTKEVLDRIG